MKRMRWKNNERRYCSAAGQQQAATAELYATLPKAGAMLTIKPSCAFEIASCQLLWGP